MAHEKRGKRNALGRGLASLIPVAATPSSSSATPALREIPLADIVPNSYQPRKTFDDPRIEELAASIKADGVIQPVLVRQVGSNKFELIAGERRWRASQRAGLETIPALVKDASDLQSLVLALEENIQRADLNPLEEALAFEQLIEEFGLTQEEVARRVGRERSTVANTIRLIRLPELVKGDLIAGSLAMGHARALLALTDPELILMAREMILSQELSVRATEDLVSKLKKAAPRKKKSRPGAGDLLADPDVKRVLADLRSHFGTKVAIRGSTNKGKIELEFYSQDDLNRLLKLLLES